MLYTSKCINVSTGLPNVTVNQANNFTICSGSATITASGANTYTWSTGSNAASIVANAVGCYTVSGSNNCGTSSTVICVGGTTTAIPQLTLTGPGSVCGPTVAALSVVNATAYTNITWTGGTIPGCCPLTGANVSPTITGAACFTVTGSNNGCTTSNVICVGYNTSTVSTSPSGNYTTCSASPVTVNAFGASTYTWYWSGGNATGSAFTPTAIGCYTVVGANTVCPNGAGSAVVCLNALTNAPTPTLNLGSGQVCAGSALQMSASGANSYVFQTVVNGVTTTYTATNSNPINVVQNTPGVYCVTLTASNGANCNAIVSNCYTVLPRPVLSATGNGTICTGSSATLTPAGAVTYTWNNSVASSNYVVSPTTTACYTLAGTGANGCTASTLVCIGVSNGGTLTIAASSPTVCKGSSVTFTAAGGTGLSWIGGPNTSTYNVIPTVSTVYTVTGAGPNGCIGTKTVAVGVNTNCAIVWPGDANNDGVVSTSDVLELGLQAGSTGASRTPGGNAYTGQFATTWAGTLSNGKNKCHADCNGDGTANANDTVAIYNNFSLTHAFRPAANSNDQITLVPNQTQLQIGKWNSINVVLGTSSNQVQGHGVAFEVAFESAKIVPDSIWIEFVNSAFTGNSNYLFFRKTQFNAGKIHAAISRIVSGDVSVAETIAIVHFKVNPQVSNGATLNFGINAAEKMDAVGVTSAVNGDSQSLSATDNLTSISKQTLASSVMVYPNPAKDVVVIKGKDANSYSLKLIDLSGRVLMNTKFTSNTSLNVSSLDNGVYFMEVSDASGVHSQRITVMH